MTRDYVNYPSDLPVETEIGTVFVSVTDGKHVYVSTPALNVGPLLTVRGAAYYVSAHWYRDPVDHTVWTGIDAVTRGLAPEDTFGIYVSREGGGTVTQAARRSVEEALQAGLGEWATIPENERFFAEGAYANANNTLRTLEEEATELSEKLALVSISIRDEHKLLDQAQKLLAKLDHPAGKGTDR